jgi:hypothetical protein
MYEAVIRIDNIKLFILAAVQAGSSFIRLGSPEGD